MTLDELASLCREAAHDLAAREPRPYPATVLLPLEGATRVVALASFPDDDAARHQALAVFAADEVVPGGAACFGFMAEAVLGTAADATDVLLVAYGARRRGTRLTAAPIQDGGLGAFLADEELDPAALPFLQPLQHAVDLAAPRS